MNKLLRNTKAFALLLIMSIVLLNTSCKKEEKGEQPVLPSIASMEMNFDDFQEVPGDAVKGMDGKITAATYNNFIYSYNTVAFWNLFTTISLYLPFEAYKTAIQQEPEYKGNNTWEWSYNFEANEQNYIATLTAKRLDNEEFSMDMSIALASLPLLKAKYFDGTCRYDHTSAEWNLYKLGDFNQVKVIEIEWTKDFVTEDATLKYTYVEAGQVETNSSITWVYDPDGVYDAGYYIVLSTGNVDIEWDTTTKAGHVKSPSYFENSDWHCWDEMLRDNVCPV